MLGCGIRNFSIPIDAEFTIEGVIEALENSRIIAEMQETEVLAKISFELNGHKYVLIREDDYRDWYGR